jgi:hypothetical protein
MKKLSVVAVAVCLFVGSSFAGWDKFGVIEDGAAEMKLGYYGGDWWLGVRYGLIDKMELFSTIGTNTSNYTVGARYQIIPALSGFLDLDLPTMSGGGTITDPVTNIEIPVGGSHDFGLTPGINFTTKFTDAISFGSNLSLAVGLAEETVMDLNVGIEFDYNFSDNVGIWLGVDFAYNDLTAEGNELDFASAITPGIGFWFTKDNLTVGTMLNAINFKHLNKDGEETIGISGGVEFAVKF